jgi:hypothetical protein
MHTSSIPGLGRYDITVPVGSAVKFGSTARLTKEKKATAQNRLDTAKSEMESVISSAQATDADRAIAAMRDRYVGQVTLTDFSTIGIADPPPPPVIGPTTVSLRLTMPPACRVVARGCRFPAQDSFTGTPRLAVLDPAGNSLTATGSADLPQSGFTCGGVEDSGVMVKTWTFDPTAWPCHGPAGK